MTLKIISSGGTILVRHCFLNIYHVPYPTRYNTPFIHLVFWDSQSCKVFAEQINNEEPVIINSLMLTPAYS